MANPWCRLYSEFADDPKVQMMSEANQRRLVMLFCEHCKDVTHDETLRAFHWRITPLELGATKAVFLEIGFIDDDWNLLSWNRRQFLSDSSTERVRRHREGKKQKETLQTANVTPPDTDTEQTQKQKKPSRAKKPREGPTKTDIAKSRHAEFKSAILAYWQAKNPGVEMPWDAAEGRNLEIWLKSSPLTTRDQFGLWLRNRFKSEVNHTERPSRWIGNITNFAAGPIDRFNKPLSNGGNNGKSSRSERAIASSVGALEILERMDSGAHHNGRSDEAGAGTGLLLEGDVGGPVA